MLAFVNKHSAQQSKPIPSPTTVDPTLDLDELLQLAQTALIGKRYTAAVAHLEAGVVLHSSSLAAVTLANLLASDLNITLPPPIAVVDSGIVLSSAVSLRMPEPHSSNAQRTLAIKLYLSGLEFELAKPVHGQKQDVFGGVFNVASAPSSSRSSSKGSSSTSLDSDEGSEGRCFSLERTLELVVGLCDQYRYGGTDNDETTPTVGETLSARAERIVRQTLLHRSISDARLRLLVFPTLSPPPSPDMPLTPSLVFAHHSGAQSSPPPIEHILHLPNRTLPSPHSARGVASLSTDGRHRLSLQVHLLYTLALLVWPSQKVSSESFWNEIMDIAGSVGGSLGSREADEIVAKAARRLRSTVDSWKSTGKKRANSIVSPPAVSVAPIRSPDALVEMAQERAGAIPTTSYFQLATVPAFAPVQFPLSNSSPPRTSKFQLSSHFGLPSPPDTPAATAPSSRRGSDHGRPHSDFAEELKNSTLFTATTTSAKPQLRRKMSTVSMAPPRLLRRVASQASISTMPVNFGRPRAPWEKEISAATALSDEASRMVDLMPMTIRATASPLSTPGGSTTTTMGVGKSWSGFRQRLDSLRTTLPLHLPFQRKSAPSASTLLRKVLVKDDETAEQMLYWEDRDFDEEQEDDAASSTAGSPARGAFVDSSPSLPTSPIPSLTSSSTKAPQVTRQRSFIDPTTSTSTSRRSSRAPSPDAVPHLIHTPPTPDKHLLAPPIPSRRQRRRERRASILSSSPQIAGIDPVLAALERNSRVGVKTTCAACEMEGLNFSRTRLGETFCSRECRQLVKEAGAK